MSLEVDVRIVLDYSGDDSEAIIQLEDELLEQVFDSMPLMVREAVVLRNDGFGNLVPDEVTRKERPWSS